MIHVQCNECGAWEVTDNHADPDSAVRCASAENEPSGSVEGSCCTDGHTHEEHAEHARTTGTSHCRPVTITIVGMPGGGVQAALDGSALN
jgi:hypothetical protein